MQHDLKQPLSYRSAASDRSDGDTAVGGWRAVGAVVVGFFAGGILAYAILAGLTLASPDRFNRHASTIGPSMIFFGVASFLGTFVASAKRRWLFVGMLIGAGMMLLACGLFVWMFVGMHGS